MVGDVFLAGRWIGTMAGNGNIVQRTDAELPRPPAVGYRNTGVAVDHGLHRMSGVEHCLYVVSSAIVVPLGGQPVILRELNHVVGRREDVHLSNDVVNIVLVH